MKKRRIIKAVIIAFVLAVLASGAGYWYMNRSQEWTSTILFEFRNKDATKGYAIDGSKTEDIVEELTSSAVLSATATKTDGLTPDLLASRLTVTPIIPELETERKDSAMKNGNEYDYFPLKYRVSYAVEGAENVQKTLFLIMQSFYEYFTLNHLKETPIPADESGFINPGYEHLTNINTLAEHVDKMIAFLQEQAEKYPRYRSVETGLSYSDLLDNYELLKKWDVGGLYSQIIANKVARNPDVLVSQAEKTIALNEQKIIDTETDIQEVEALLNSYSDKHKVYDSYVTGTDFQPTEAESDQDNRIDANHQNILAELYENGAKDQPAYDKVMGKFVTEMDTISLLASENLYNKFLISVFQDAESLSGDLDVELTNQVLELSVKTETLYQQTLGTYQEHLEYISSENIRSLSTPDKSQKYRVKLYSLVLGIGVFIMATIGLLWLGAVRRRLQENGLLHRDRSENEEAETMFISSTGTDLNMSESSSLNSEDQREGGKPENDDKNTI